MQSGIPSLLREAGTGYLRCGGAMAAPPDLPVLLDKDRAPGFRVVPPSKIGVRAFDDLKLQQGASRSPQTR